jgi:peptidoglycan/xylan/chitin deacetylase (PgdA/CDA1 family)
MRANIISFAKRLARQIIGRPIVGKSILMYHRIAEAEFDPFNLAVSPDQFERQLARLRRKKVLPLTEFASLHMQKRLPPNAVAITFDDGYACNALVAAPLLESFGYPATFFVVSEAIERAEEFWWDQLEVIVRRPEFDWEAIADASTNGSLTGLGGTIHRGIAPHDAYLALWPLLHRLPSEERRRLLNVCFQRMGLNKTARPTHRPMTEAELLALAANPLFEIGGHTATHPALPILTATEQEREIVSSSRLLEATIGKPIRSFSYPFGDWGHVTRDIVMAAGFECAVTGVHRRVRSGDNQFELPRRMVVNLNAQTP